MAKFTLGPVELYLIALRGDQLSPGAVTTLTDLVANGTVCLLDMVIIAKSVNGDISVTEVEGRQDAYGLTGVEFAATGIAGDEDVAELAQAIPAGGAAALVAVELVWAKHLAEQIVVSGSEVLAVERIPAPVVNAFVDVVTGAPEQPGAARGEN
ncbi:hypothetical protein GCM10028798_13300 [Humibacter antri]